MSPPTAASAVFVPRSTPVASKFLKVSASGRASFRRSSFLMVDVLAEGWVATLLEVGAPKTSNSSVAPGDVVACTSLASLYRSASIWKAEWCSAFVCFCAFTATDLVDETADDDEAVEWAD